MPADEVSQSPLCNDSVTPLCPACGRPYVASGRRRFCSDACRVAAWRRRHRQVMPVVLPPRRRRAEVTVYACDACGLRALGVQRCEECGSFMRKVGLGGSCPECDSPVAISDLLDEIPSGL